MAPVLLGCIPHFAGSFTTLSAEGGVRPDVHVGSARATFDLGLSGPLAGLLPLRRTGRP